MDDPSIPPDEQSVWFSARKPADPPERSAVSSLTDDNYYARLQTLNIVFSAISVIVFQLDTKWAPDGWSKVAYYTSAFAIYVYFITTLTSPIVFLGYIASAYRNLQDMEVQDLPFSCGWMQVCFYIPILNIFMPWWMMQQLWKASAVPNEAGDGYRWQKNPTSLLITLWWASYLTWSYLAWRFLFIPKSIHRNALIYNDLIGLVPCFLSILVVKAIQKRQEQRAHALGLEIQSGPSGFRYSSK